MLKKKEGVKESVERVQEATWKKRQDSVPRESEQRPLHFGREVDRRDTKLRDRERKRWSCALYCNEQNRETK